MLSSFLKISMLSFILFLSPFLPLLGFFHESPKTCSTQDSGIEAENLFINLAKFIDPQELLKEAWNISSLGPRVTGYSGYYSTVQYIIQRLNKTVAEIEVQKYSILVPVDEGSFIILPNGTQIKAYALWPNGILTSSTPENGFKGKLVYVGRGDLENLDGKDIQGSIVLLDYNSGYNWIKPIMFGAQAVIFAGTSSDDFQEAITKFLDTPLYAPRIYVNESIGEALKKLARSEPIITVKVNMKWREKEAYNIIGKIEGTGKPEETILLATYIDSFTIAPALKNTVSSFNEAISISLLFRLAEYLQSHKPYRSVWIVFLSGHWQALSGIREFVEKYYFSRGENEPTFRPVLFINIGPFSMDGRRISVTCTSYFSMAGETEESFTIRYGILENTLYNKYLQNLHLATYLNNSLGLPLREYVYVRLRGSMFWGFEYFPYLSESEIILSAGGLGISIMSSGPKHWLISTLQTSKPPFHPSRWLEAQVLVASYIALSFTFDRELTFNWQVISPKRLNLAPSEGGISGFITLYGKVLRYNASIGWYSPVSNAIVRVRVSGLAYPFSQIIVRTDENGVFIVHGLAPSPLISGRTSKQWSIDAWVIDERGMEILSAPDMGIYGAKAFNTYFTLLQHPYNISIVVSDATTVTLFDPIDIKNLRLPQLVDYRLPHQRFLTGEAVIQPLDFETKAELFFYGVYFNNYEPVALIFVPKGSRIAVTASFMSSGMLYTRPIFLTNTSIDNPEGWGFNVKYPLKINFTIYSLARDVYSTAVYRYQRLREKNVRNIFIENTLEKASEYLDRAKKFYEMKNYSRAYGDALIALAYAYTAYENTMNLLNDAGTSAVFFFILIIVSAILLERLLFDVEGKWKIAVISAIFTLFIALFSLVHPAFAVMSNSVMGLLGSVSFVLFVVVIGILLGEGEKVIKSISREILGIHVAETGRLGTAFMLFSASINNMKSRPLRTFLTLFTIAVTVASIVALTSSSYTVELASVPYVQQVPFNLILLKKSHGIPPEGPLQRFSLNYLKSLLGKDYMVSPRAWLYPQSVYPYGNIIEVAYGDNKVTVSAAIGVTPYEAKLLSEFSSVAASRGFYEDDYYAVILTSSLAKRLNVTIGDTLRVMGFEMVLVDILNDEALNMVKDPDGYSITPLDPLYVPALGQGVTAPATFVPSLPWDRVVIVPYRFAMDHGGYIGSIAVYPLKNVSKKEIERIAGLISTPIDIPVFYSWDETGYQLSKITRVTVLGLESIFIILAISSVDILISLLAGVKERSREIYIMSALGLSPLGITISFAIETFAYIFLSVLIGYFAGFALNGLFVTLNLLPESFVFNFASVNIVLSLMVLIAISFIVLIYPAYIASRMVTPSLKRRWEIPTKPKGDLWEIPLMVKIPSLIETIGILKYLKEFYEGYGKERRTYVVTKVIGIEEEPPTLTINVHLSPYEMRVTEEVRIRAFKQSDGSYVLTLLLRRLSGSSDVWRTSNYYFVDDVRKQILLWRTLPPHIKKRYLG